MITLVKEYVGYLDQSGVLDHIRDSPDIESM